MKADISDEQRLATLARAVAAMRAEQKRYWSLPHYADGKERARQLACAKQAEGRVDVLLTFLQKHILAPEAETAPETDAPGQLTIEDMGAPETAPPAKTVRNAQLV